MCNSSFCCFFLLIVLFEKGVLSKCNVSCRLIKCKLIDTLHKVRHTSMLIGLVNKDHMWKWPDVAVNYSVLTPDDLVSL